MRGSAIKKISRHLGHPDRQPRWTELQNFYSLLSSKQEEPQVDIYKVITEHIDEYKQDVKDELLNLSNPWAASKLPETFLRI